MPRPIALLGAVTLVTLLALPAGGRAPLNYPPPKALGPVETYGTNVQRTMNLLAGSTALKRNTVRILFYGQSITAGDWTKMVAEHIRRQFPQQAALGFVEQAYRTGE